MSKYLIKRILLAILSVFVILLITFFAMNAVPGGPFNSEKATTPAVRAVLMERFNLDKPVWQQFLIYIKNLTRFDFGVSLKTGREISGTLSTCFAVSAKIGGIAAFVAVIIGVVLGAIAALFRNHWPDRLIIFFTTLFTMAPRILDGRIRFQICSAGHRPRSVPDSVHHQTYQDQYAGRSQPGLHPYGKSKRRYDPQGHL